MKARRRHLRGHETRPDQPVQLILIRREVGLDVFRGERDVHRPDGFVRVLRAGLALEIALAAGGQIVLAETPLDVRRGGALRFGRDAHRVGTHVGDEGRGAALAKLHPFVQALRDVHGAFGRVAEPLVGALLQGGCGEGRLRRPRTLLFLHGSHHAGLTAKGFFQGGGGRRVGDLRLFALHLPQFRAEGGRCGAFKERFEHPVFLGGKGAALFLPLHNEPQGHRLHPPGGDAALHVLPQQGGNLVPDKPVQHAPRLLRVKQGDVEIARVGQGFPHGPRRDFVELNALDVGVLVLHKLRHMPGNGLAFAVRVRREVDDIRLGRRLPQGGNHLFLARDHLVMRGEAVGFIHANGTFGQVAHMPHAGLNRVAGAEKFLDGLHLGG